MRGEGELTWCELVATLKNVAPLDTIKGITYKKWKEYHKESRQRCYDNRRFRGITPSGL